MKLFNKKYNVIIFGADGQLGNIVYKEFFKYSMAYNSIFNKVIGLSKNDIDISDYDNLKYLFSNCEFFNNIINEKLHYEYDLQHLTDNDIDKFQKPLKFDIVINCAAATNVLECEQKDFRNISYKANVLGPKNLSELCKKYNMHLIHISTDYILSNFESQTSQKANIEFPLSIYGTHKLLGEKYIKLNCDKYSILRTSWLYGNSNNTFIHKFLKNCYKCVKNKTYKVNVASDCYGRPTNVYFLAGFIYNVIKNKLYGIMDAQQNQLAISRYDYALDIKNYYINNLKANVGNIKEITKTEVSNFNKIKIIKKENKEIIKDNIYPVNCRSLIQIMPLKNASFFQKLNIYEKYIKLLNDAAAYGYYQKTTYKTWLEYLEYYIRNNFKDIYTIVSN